MLAVNPELERRVLEQPDDLGARVVYADWLQQQGDPRGTYAALSLGNDRLAAWRFLDEHRDEILGPGAALLEEGRVAWRGGFVDELHTTSYTVLPLGVFAHPSFRFVRHVRIVDKHDNAMLAELRAAELPLLESAVVMDPRDIEQLAGLGIRRLCVVAGTWPVHGVVRGVAEVWVVGHEAEVWLQNGNCPGAIPIAIPWGERYAAEVVARSVANDYRRDELLMLPWPGLALVRASSDFAPGSVERRRLLALAVTFPNTDGEWHAVAHWHREAGELVDAEIAELEARRRGRP